MKNVLLIMQRKILADALTRAMRDDERFQLFTEYDYSNALMTCQCAQAHVAVLEIPESGPWTPMRCFSLGDSLKERCPGFPGFFFFVFFSFLLWYRLISPVTGAATGAYRRFCIL